MWLLVPVVGTAVCWALSFRRTPWPVIWLFPCLILAGLGMLEVAGAMSVHHSLVGMIAVSTASLVPQAICGLANEACAMDNGALGKWRKNRSRRIKPGRWNVITQHGDNNDVWVGVRNGSKTRWVGHADPVSDMDAFMDLRVKATQNAETLTALKIQPEAD